MSQELLDFQYFRDNQLKNVDFSTGIIDVKIKDKVGKYSRSASNVGSKNNDGYIRLWCNGKLRMKHRLLFWLYHNYIPIEVDHDNSIRDDNCINNLIESDRKRNNKNKVKTSVKHLSTDDVIELCQIIQSGNYTITELAKKFNRSRVQIKAILTKRCWSKISDQYF